MSQIDERIWVGSSQDSANMQFLQDRGIEHIICCAEEYAYPPGFLYISQKTNQWHRVPIHDNVANQLTETQFKDSAAKLNEWITQGKNVLVHCHEGKSRSVSAVIAYFMIYKDWSFDIAFWHIKRKRPIMNPYREYIPILMAIGAKEPYTFLER